MANFAPQGKVRIGRVPFDNSYRHTMTFPTREAQTEFFTSCCTRALDKETYTYVRMNNAIRVMFNAEDLYTYDYVMYQNANYGTKWFYAFIVGVNYVNENCTELVLELDVMQTWYFDYTLVETFVEREHVNDDTRGLHLNEEPAMPLQYQRRGYSEHIMTPAYAVLLINAYMHYLPSTGEEIPQSISNGVDACEGGWVQGQYSACKYAIYNLNSANSRQRLSLDVQSLNLHGAAETIADAYTLPSGCFKTGEPVIDGEDSDLTRFPVKVGDTWTVSTGEVYTLKDTAVPNVTNISAQWPSTLGTYTPRNNKLLCYPYSYWEVGDFAGRTTDLRWEYFASPTCTLRQKLVASSDCQGYVSPMDYNGVNNTQTGDTLKDNGISTFTFDYQNKIPWVYSTYQNWAAQNSMNNQLAILGGAAAMAFSLVPGIGAAGKALGAGLGEAAALSAAGYPNFARMATANAGRMGAQALGENTSMSGLAGGGAAVLGTLANIDRMRKHPNTANGNTGGNSKIQNGYGGWYDAQVCLLPEYAAIVDGFFDMYGYQVDSLKVPNREGRPYWNYVKCQNSAHRGAVPSDMMSKINAIYDAGITFWHTPDVGNYSLDNRIQQEGGQ